MKTILNNRGFVAFLPHFRTLKWGRCPLLRAEGAKKFRGGDYSPPLKGFVRLLT